MEYFKTYQLKNCSESDVVFYKHYFDNIARQMDRPLNDFVDPLNYRSSQKTLNNDYISLLFTSPMFRRDFHAYLASDQLKSAYRHSVPSKLFKVLVRFERLMHDNGMQKMQETIESVQWYFRKNKQCKLPWTEVEVNTAVDNLLQLCKE